jgi:hypothetical protein
MHDADGLAYPSGLSQKAVSGPTSAIGPPPVPSRRQNRANALGVVEAQTMWDHLLALLAKTKLDVDFAFDVAFVPGNIHAPEVTGTHFARLGFVTRNWHIAAGR